jgi:hypothetical protein
MENQITENNSSITPVGEQIPLTTPQSVQLNTAPRRNYSYPILIALLLAIVVGVSIYLFTYSNQSAKKQIVLPTNSPTTISNPNTGDLYQDINVRMKELLP